MRRLAARFSLSRSFSSLLLLLLFSLSLENHTNSKLRIYSRSHSLRVLALARGRDGLKSLVGL